MDAQQLLFGPRPVKKGDGAVPRHYFLDSERGSTKTAIAYLKSRGDEIADNPELRQLTEIVVDSEVRERFGEEDFFELRPDQNSHAIDCEIIADEELAAREINQLYDGFIKALNRGEGDALDMITDRLWKGAEIGPLALKMVNSFASEEWQEDQVDYILAILIVADNQYSPLSQALRRQLGWMLLRRSENLAHFLLRDLSIISDCSEIFAIERDGNVIHLFDGEGFVCGHKGEEHLRALRGVWRECARFLGDEPLYRRCPDCEAKADLFLTPGCEDLLPSFLDWPSYHEALAYADELIGEALTAEPAEELIGGDYDLFLASVHIQIETIVAKLRVSIKQKQAGAVASRIATTLASEHRPDNLALLENFWGSELVENLDEHIIATPPPTEDIIYDWIEEIFNDDIEDESELGDYVYRLCHCLNDQLQTHFSVNAGEFRLSDLR